MKWLNELLGFVVLTSPLWLILVLLPVSIWIAFKIAKRFKQKSAKIAIGVGVFLIVFFVPFADEIAGRIYFNHLCATKAGVKVYQIVELPAKYWDGERRARFINSRGILIKEVFGDRFEWRSIDEPYINLFIKIDRERWLLRDNQSKHDLGEKITFVRYYGWLNRFSPAPNVGESCRDLWAKKYGQDVFFQKENSAEKDFLLKIFIPPLSPQ